LVNAGKLTLVNAALLLTVTSVKILTSDGKLILTKVLFKEIVIPGIATTWQVPESSLHPTPEEVQL
jgi:hypothetical protein